MVRERCEEIGRDPATLETSTLISVIVDDKATVDQIPEDFRARSAIGTPEAIAEQIKTKVFDAGVTGIVFNMPVYTPGAIAAVGRSAQAGAADLTNSLGGISPTLMRHGDAGRLR